MDEKREATASLETERGSLTLIDLLLAPYDELVEVDTNLGRMRALRHVEGKYFVPVIDAAVKDMLRYSARYMIHPEDQETYISFNDPATLAQRFRESETPGLMRARFRYKLLSGGWRLVEQINIGGAEQGLPAGVYYAFIFDIEQKHNSEEELASTRENMLTRHALTGLLWEEQFFKRGKRFVQEHADDWCMIAFDLEHFKLFNEWYGRKQGDLLLARFGAKIREVELATGGLGCYVGQDDFCLLAPYDMENIRRLYDELHGLVKEYGTSVGFMPAFGVAPLAANESCSVEELYDRAALAARRAKENFHTRIRVFDPAMYEQTEKDYQILSDFQDALDNQELFFVLQPQCQIASGKIVGAESLVRWRKANGEMVSPGVFVPVLEEYGFVTDMDKYVWESVCAWQRQWIDSGRTPLPVSVNVSQADISAIDVPDFFAQLMEKYSLPTDVIKIEITESAYVDNDKVADTVQRLREMGFLVLMDDFGSGYSSLNMLRNMNIDVIKLDAQFLRMSGDDRRKGQQIMETIVNMAKTMGVPIIVEGVETREESDFLAGLGCSYVQGYFFYRPMPVSDFEKLISGPERIDTGGFRFKMKDRFHTREFLDQNMFSDKMLNNILGPVAFYLWHGDDVDIVRFNEQYYKEFRMPALHRHMKQMQRMLVEEDIPTLHYLLNQAMRDPLEGAESTLRFQRPDGSISQFRMHFFFVERDESGKRFYGSLRDLTEFITLNDHIRLLSAVVTDSVLFVRRKEGRWLCRVTVHALADDLGLAWLEFEEELNNGAFYQRLDQADRERLVAFTGDQANNGVFSEPFRVAAANGKTLRLRMKCDAVRDKKSGVEYILTLRKEA